MSVSVDPKKEIISACYLKLKQLGLNEDKKHQDRLLYEIKQIDNQMEFDYIFELFKNGDKFENNENNLLITYLLGMVDNFDINIEPRMVQGEFPDIDTDFQDEVCDYIRNVWAPKTFGEDNVCAIGTYGTFKIKSSFLDAARVYDKDRNEILNITTKIGLKDEDGKVLSLDKAIEEYPDLRKYCEENPEVADVVRRIINRNKTVGTHAGGLIISNQRIDNIVPFVKTESDKYVSAFGEGLLGTDLGPLGLIKIDTLRLSNLTQLAQITKSVKQRLGISSICAYENCPDWSNEDAYITDLKALNLANQGRLKCIFQFDSDGIREMVKKGGVDIFYDLVIYSSIYRPGPLSMKMDERFIERKKGREYYELHPVLEPILKKTYGVMCFQEQTLKILNVVGGIPEMHCEIIRKAISKKKVKVFQKYKDMFIENGQKVLAWTKEQVEELWTQIEAFAEYGFNSSHAVCYTILSARLLYLKAHYPLDFFVGILKSVKDDVKIKEYRREAESMNVKIKPLDLNKSKDNFSIVDDEIYIGFSNIKGIGEEVAQRIVENQPYSSFVDFLSRFGTDAKVLKPLISLGLFKDADRTKLYSYYEYFKEEQKKISSRNDRYAKSVSKLILELKVSFEDEFSELFFDKFENFDETSFKSFNDFKFREEIIDSNEQKDIIHETWKLLKKYKKSKESNVLKNEQDSLLSLDEFDIQVEIDEDLQKLFNEPVQVAESSCYGFSWNHLMDSSPDYSGGFTISDFDSKDNICISMVEAQVIEKPKRKESAKGTVYYEVTMEDSDSFKFKVTFWDVDYQRFASDLEYWESDIRKGNFLKIRLKKPEPPFKNYTFDSPPKAIRWKEIPEKKEDDTRLLVMKRPFMDVVKPKKKPELIVI
jgi:DNA polymerase III alpha subunit